LKQLEEKQQNVVVPAQKQENCVRVIYLAKKLEQGPDEGSRPSKVVVPLKNVNHFPIDRYQLLEQQLTT